MSDLSKVVDQVRAARWALWSQMASELPDYHILSVELLRTQDNETLAVFTVVRDRRPVQYVLQGDATGANLRAPQQPPPRGISPVDVELSDRGESCAMTPPRPPRKGAPPTGVHQGKPVLTGVHLGEPAPQQPRHPGIHQGKPVLTGVHLGEPAPQQPPPRGIPPVDMALSGPGDGSAEGTALGHLPPTPGIVSLGMSLLTTAFNLGEWAAANGATPVRR